MTSGSRRPGINLASLPAEVRAWLRGLAEDGGAVVTSFRERDAAVILLTRKGRPDALARWRTVELRILSFGPPDAPLLIRDGGQGALSVRARPPGSRDARLSRRLARLVLGYAPPPGWHPDAHYSLEPLEKGIFAWGGDERVAGVVLTQACLRVPGTTEAYLTVTSGDVRRTFREEIPQFAVEGGELIQARFHVAITVDGGEEHVSFTVRPPRECDLARRPHRDLVAAFLRDQGVMRG